MNTDSETHDFHEFSRITVETVACATLDSGRSFSLSSLRGRRGPGRGGPSCLRLHAASALGCPSPQPSPRSFLTGRGSRRCRLSCGYLSITPCVPIRVTQVLPFQLPALG